MRKRKQDEKWESYPVLAKFADGVRECNKKNLSVQWGMMLQAVLFWGALNCVITIVTAIGVTGMAFFPMVCMAALLDGGIGLCWGIVYCNGYTNIEGKRGKSAQML
ncbi:MAG: hypothetical protein ACI4A3_09910 [Lachnospiraceae bacterium]